ncbi:PorT family protein [Pontibacter sp. KCTC 32443]|uniref:type IX secretion/gliding motility protein PorT/SprT n=1 Tax=Pontibacter TaxID=323449 RepID=UPI00164ED410|nr:MULTISPECIES: porin family protein [Pontibacter]MBC5775281.1 PorT family protein [Pontibacter sp. KCTC 32443]
MAFSYIWHKLYLHRTKITLFVLLAILVAAPAAQAQKKINTLNKADYDNKPIHYGFYLAAPLTRYSIQHSQEYADQLATDPSGGGVITVNAKFSPGFYTGLVLNVRLADYLDARFVPGVGFYSRKIEFTNMPQETGEVQTVDKTISSTMVELPLLLKYKAKRRSNARMYLVGGIKPGIDLGSGKSDENPDKGLAVEKFDLALEYGFGVDMFYPFFKFAPEIRFSHGLINQHKLTQSEYSRLLQKQTNHNISLILFFE